MTVRSRSAVVASRATARPHEARQPVPRPSGQPQTDAQRLLGGPLVRRQGVERRPRRELHRHRGPGLDRLLQRLRSCPGAGRSAAAAASLDPGDGAGPPPDAGLLGKFDAQICCTNLVPGQRLAGAGRFAHGPAPTTPADRHPSAEQSAWSGWGIHGLPHWGLSAWERAGDGRVKWSARKDVVELFVFLDDSEAVSSTGWIEHGARAVDYVLELESRCVFCLARRAGLELLTYALVPYYSDGLLEVDPHRPESAGTVDRLDLGRVGKMPWAEELCTEEARDPGAAATLAQWPSWRG